MEIEPGGQRGLLVGHQRRMFAHEYGRHGHQSSGEILGRWVPGIIGAVRERWLSKRALRLHAGLLFFVPACAVAAWWQITRATDGNGLSYLYAVEWPVFAILGVYFWWMLIHTDYDSVGLKGMRKRESSDAALPPTAVAPTSVTPVPVTPPAAAPADGEDPELAAYNARLASLSAHGPQTWRHREHTVVRRGPTS